MALIEYDGLEGPLQQGDLLKDVELYMTEHDNSAIVAEFDSIIELPMCLVLSRNCRAVRAPWLVVMSIDTFKTNEFKKILDDEPSFDGLRRRMDSIRDAKGNPDLFYLGDLKGYKKFRFAANFSSIHTINVEQDQAKRKMWVKEHRFGRLSKDHRRHLHAALLGAFSGEGFDDYAWWCDQDLRMMLDHGHSQLYQLRTNLMKTRNEIQVDPPTASPTKKQKQRQNTKTGLERRISQLTSEIEPYKLEWIGRGNEDEWSS